MAADARVLDAEGTFPSRLEKAMGRQGLSRIELASKAGISRQAVGRYLNGRRLPGADRLTRIASSLGVSVDWLLGLED